MTRGEIALGVLVGTLSGLIAAGWIYTAGYEQGEEHGRKLEQAKQAIKRDEFPQAAGGQR